MRKLKKSLILLELNEVNFEIVKDYVELYPSRFPSLKKLLSYKKIITIGEENYSQLEPWIQWVSVHTTKKFDEHRVFRLGDIIDSNAPQIFEKIEQGGFKVGSISAFNAANRLKKPAYFIPDPWTNTPTDTTFWSKCISEAISQAVQDNSKSKITVKSALQLLISLIRFFSFKHIYKYFSLFIGSQKKPWFKALFLDLFLHDVHINLFNSNKPNFSTLFLNAGAHIQHHYFFNAKPLHETIQFKNPTWYINQSLDPICDFLDLYDLLIGEYFELKNTEIIIATGLSQRPYDYVKFYYRLNDHAKFLSSLGIVYSNIVPLMTRDFLINFDSEKLARNAYEILTSLKVENNETVLFGEIDNRGHSLFVSLTYPLQISEDTKFIFNSNLISLYPLVNFVAIKNGMHQSEGYAFFTPEIGVYAPNNKAHVNKLGKCILDYFELSI